MSYKTSKKLLADNSPESVKAISLVCPDLLSSGHQLQLQGMHGGCVCYPLVLLLC